MTEAVIFLMGPTASGKTSLAVELVKHLPLEIISVDSAMVYRGMDIGTAKPGREVLEAAPHHLLDICEPTESYSAGRFRRDAMAAIEDIRKNNRIPILVGGTGLYFRSLEQGFSNLPATDPALRARLTKMLLTRFARCMQITGSLPVRATPASKIRSASKRALGCMKWRGQRFPYLPRKGRRDMPAKCVKLALVPPERRYS